MSKNKEPETKIWSYEAANATVPYVRSCLSDLRRSFVLTWHYFKKSGYNKKHITFGKEIKKYKEEGRDALTELSNIGVVAFESPLRGIVLFPIIVYCSNKKLSTTREAYLVYKDTNDSISTFVFNDEISAFCDLYNLGEKRPGVVER